MSIITMSVILDRKQECLGHSTVRANFCARRLDLCTLKVANWQRGAPQQCLYSAVTMTAQGNMHLGMTCQKPSLWCAQWELLLVPALSTKRGSKQALDMQEL